MTGTVGGAVQKAPVRRRGGPSKMAGHLALFYEKKKKTSCKNIIGRKINRLEPEGVNSSQPVILIMMEKDWRQSLQLAVRGCPIGWISLLSGIDFNLYSRRGKNHRRAELLLVEGVLLFTELDKCFSASAPLAF